MSAIFAFFLSPIGRIVGACSATAFVVAFVSVWATSTIDNVAYLKLQNSIATEHANNAEASLTQYHADVGTIHDAAIAFGGIKNDLNSSLDKLAKDFHNEQVAHPLPVSCRPSSERLRQLTLAVAAANAAAFGQ